MALERWIVGQQAKGNNTAVTDGKSLLDKYGDIRLDSAVTPIEIRPLSQEFRPFTGKEILALIADGAVILNLVGETIEDEQKARRLFQHVTDGGDRLLKLPSIVTQVAIFADPKRFFIRNSNYSVLGTVLGFRDGFRDGPQVS